MKRAALALALFLIATAARSDGIGNQGIIGQDVFGGIGGAFKAPAPIVCNPGAANGQMDFSVCSNIAITAALW